MPKWVTKRAMLGALGFILVLVLGIALTLNRWLPEQDTRQNLAGVAQTIVIDNLHVTLQLDEPVLGSRVIDVFLRDAAGNPVTVSTVRLRFSMAEMDMGRIEADAQPLGAGRFRAQGPFFSMAGRWNVEALVASNQQAPLQVPFVLAIAAPGEASGPLNPLRPDEATLAAGRQLYQANCAVCHGASGKGDGPAAVGLRPAPGDFTQHMQPGKHTEGQTFLWIKDGYPGSAMPAWRQRLTEEQIWQLVTYLRTFAQVTASATSNALPATPSEPAITAPTIVSQVQEPLPPLIFTRAGNIWRSDGTANPPRALTRLEAGLYAEYPTLAPDGQQIAFVGTTQGPLAEGEWPLANPETSLYVMRADGAGQRLLWKPERGRLGLTAWAPDGAAIYVGYYDVLSAPEAPVPDRLFQIIRVDLQSGARQVALEDAYDLTFAPDGSLIAFLRWHDDQAAFTLNIAAPDGNGERELITGSAFSQLYAPRFSPDRRQIIFASPGGPPTDPQGYPTTGRDPSPLDKLLGFFEVRAAEAHGATSDLWIVNTDGSGLRRITGVREDTPMAVFSPDGKQIAMMGGGGIYLMNVDGSNLRKIDPLGDHGGLDWAHE